MLHLYLILLFIVGNSSANSDERRHRQRLPMNINAILASYSQEREFRASDEVDTVTNSPAGVSFASSPTKSPNSVDTSPAVAEVTDFPTEDIFATRAPTSKPTASPTVTSR